MYGQWIGRLQGTNDGTVLLNIDRDRPDSGCLQVNDYQQPFSAEITLAIKGRKLAGDIRPYPTANPVITLPSNGRFSVF